MSDVPFFKVLDRGIVDDEQWYTVRVYRVPIMRFVRSQKRDWWWEHPHNGVDGIRFDIHGKLFTMLALGYSS